MAGEEQCIFCLIRDNKMPSLPVYEDDFVKAVMEKYPSTKGQLIVIIKKHVTGIHELSEDEISGVFIACQRIIFGMTQVLGCEGVNLVYNLGEVAGQRTPHMIIYLIPRYKDDQVTLIWPPQQLDDKEVKQAYESLVGALKGAAVKVIKEERAPAPVIEEKKEEEIEVIEEKPRVPDY